MWSSLTKLQSCSLSEFRIAPIYFCTRRFCFVQTVLDFFHILSVVHRVHCCEKHWLPILFEASSSWNQPVLDDGVHVIGVTDVGYVLGEVIRQQYIVLQCRINEITSECPWIVRGTLLTKESDSSFAEAHKGILSEPTHIEGEDEDWEYEVEDERDREECKVENRWEIKHTSAWHMDDMTRTTPWANVTCNILKHACKYEKMWRVRVFCSHTPSVAADCHQLWTIFLQQIFS